jgi:dipeptidyl aminopeptidase/acylaminoacyl peptidase
MSRQRSSQPLFLLLLVAWIGAAGCRSAPHHEAPAGSAGSAASVFFRDPPLAHVRLSPDGARIIGMTFRGATRVLVDNPLRGGEIRYLDKFEDREAAIAAVGWSGDTLAVVGVERPDPNGVVGARAVEFFAFDFDRWRPLQVATGWRVPSSTRTPPVLHWLPDDPERVLVSWSEPGEESVRVRRVLVRTGVGSETTPDDLAAERWFADRSGALRAARVRHPEGLALSVSARAGSDEHFEPLVDSDLSRESSLAFAGFSADPSRLYVYADTEQGRRGVFAYDLRARRRGALVASHPGADAGELMYRPGSESLWAVEFQADRPELRFTDEAAAREQASIDATFPGTRNRIIDSDRNGATVLLEVSGDVRPPEYYVYDREKREIDLLYAAFPGLEPAALAPMRAVRFPARDGLEIPAYLTLPSGASGALPVIVMPHDGPTERDVWGWDARVQFFASRGFAVFQPNFRGSSGYGHDFERRGYAAWGGAMQDDLVDGVRWLVAQGIADPGRVGVFGEGYGGYAALMCALAAPGEFRAVASWGGITDLVDFVENPARRGISDPNTPIAWATPRDRERLHEISPAQRADAIRVPVLLGHGMRDRVVDVGQTRSLAEALEGAGSPVESYLYRDEPRMFIDAGNRIDFYGKLAAFFERHLLPPDAGGAP